MRCILKVLFFGVFVSLSACKEPVSQFVFMENGTSSSLVVTANFQSAEGNSSLLTFKLQPGHRDGWRYLDDTKALDKSFLFLTVKTDRCDVKLNRSQLEKRIRKNGSWTLLIDENLTLCE